MLFLMQFDHQICWHVLYYPVLTLPYPSLSVIPAFSCWSWTTVFSNLNTLHFFYIIITIFIFLIIYLYFYLFIFIFVIIFKVFFECFIFNKYIILIYLLLFIYLYLLSDYINLYLLQVPCQHADIWLCILPLLRCYHRSLI